MALEHLKEEEEDGTRALIPQQPTDVIYAAVNLQQKWRSLLIANDRGKLEGVHAESTEVAT